MNKTNAVLLLFLLLNLTACQTWQSIGPVSPGRFIELDRPERVRVYMRGGDQVELERPAVDGDELVAPGGFSMPLADVLRLEVRELHILRSLGAGYLGGLAVVGLAMVIEIVRCGDLWAC